MNDPERLDLPSASSFSITANCPGAPALIRSLPKESAVVQPVDEMAERGTRIHEAWRTGDTSNLAEDELEDYDATLKLAEQSEQQWLKDHPGEVGQTRVITRQKEQRLWYHNYATMKPEASGQFDDLLIIDKHAYVRDLKSGWCKNLTSSEQNWQLRLLAVLVWIEYGPLYDLQTVRASFLKPKFYRRAIDTVEYDLPNLQFAKTSIDQVLWDADGTDAQRRPGDHCNYCPGKAYCPEAAAYAMVPSMIGLQPISETLDKESVEEWVKFLTPEQLGKVQKRAKLVTKILEAVKGRLKAMQGADLAAIGLKIGDGRNLDPIVHTREAFNALVQNAAGTAWLEGMWASLKFSKGDLVTNFKLAHPDWTKKRCEEFLFKEVLKDCIEPKKSEGSLEEL